MKNFLIQPIRYQKSQDRIVYTIHEDIATVEIIQAGSPENVYKELTRKI